MYDFDTTTRRFISKECRDIDGINTAAGERYFRIWDFMLFDLKLANSDLIIYAQIFTMYKNRNGAPYRGTKEYLAKWANTTVRTVSDVLNSLEERGYIVKIYDEYLGKKHAMYCIDFEKLPTCRAFSKENYFADQISKFRENCEKNGKTFDKRAFYKEIARPRTDREVEELTQYYVDNRKSIINTNEKIKNYYKTRKIASSK